MPPAIEYRDGIFYVINTCIGRSGNCVVTATSFGPWSDSFRLPHLDGIDPSIFFDEDGKAYIVHHAKSDENAIRHLSVAACAGRPLAPLRECMRTKKPGREYRAKGNHDSDLVL